MELKSEDPNKHREGTLIAFVDLIHKLTDLEYGEDKELPEEEKIEKLSEVLKTIRGFDITHLGNLYLTSGGRIVLDKGYGEYFDKSDKVLFSLDKLKGGINAKEFQKKINDAISEVSAP